jgi:hypothetical protein
MSMSEAQRTRNHDTIQKWAEERDGHPATVKSTAEAKGVGVLRIDFPEYSGGETLEPISWEAFFDKFDRENLDFLYQEKTSNGEVSHFCKFVNREQQAASS